MKRPIQSKTIWFNLAAAVVAALEAGTPMLQDVVGGEVILGGVAIGNVILRFLTSEPIGRQS